MTESDADDDLHGLLFAAFAPSARPADDVFVAQVEKRVANWERYRLWRRQVVRRFLTHLFSMAAMGCALGLISRAPEAASAVSEEPTLIWVGLLIMLLCWLGLTGVRPQLLRDS